MVKISCISHFIDNLHAFETDEDGKNVEKKRREETKGESARVM